MIYEILSIALIVDSTIALLISFTKLGDSTIEQHFFIKRYLPLTAGWTILYSALSFYIGYLTFFGV